MEFNSFRKQPIGMQLLFCIIVVVGMSITSFLLKDVFGYREIALILLMTVSVLAMLFEIVPVLISAVMSALIWNFFFIPPLFTFHINNTEDTLLFSLYFIIALVHAVLSVNIRRAEKQALEKEEKANSVKLYNTLFNSLSHELRTPIATIIGSVDALQEQEAKLSSDNKAVLLQEIADAGLRLNRQVDNLLNMSRLESGMLKPKPDWCDPEELLKQVLDKLPAHTQDIRLHLPDPIPFIKIDAGLLEQILNNLVYNAIIYTPEHAIVYIELHIQEKQCLITVEDSGPGFPDAELSKVFEKFHRLPKAKAGGSGLGLSIVKGYVEAMGGHILLSNRRAGGARFEITLPAEISFMNQLHHE